MKIEKKIIIIMLLLAFLNTLSLSQTLNLHSISNEKLQFELTIKKPFQSDLIEHSTFSGIYDILFNIPLNRKFNLVGDIPFNHIDYDLNYRSEGFRSNYGFSKSGLGNIFIGLQLKPDDLKDKMSYITFGVNLPTADEDAAFNAIFYDYYEFQKYIPNTLGLYFNYAFHKIRTQGFYYALEFGPNILIPTGDSKANTEIYVHYGVDLGVQIRKIIINAELTGIGFVTASTDNFSDRLVNILGLGLHWDENFIMPKVFYRIYLKEELSNMIDGVLGIGVAVNISNW